MEAAREMRQRALALREMAAKERDIHDSIAMKVIADGFERRARRLEDARASGVTSEP